MDAFRRASMPLWITAWEKKLEPHVDTLPLGMGPNVDKLLTDDEFAYYDNYFAVM